jgi:hypothetical protein
MLKNNRTRKTKRTNDMIPDLISEHKAYCEESGDMWRIQHAAGRYFVDNESRLSNAEAFVLGQLYACSSVDEAEYIYNAYVEAIKSLKSWLGSTERTPL